MVTGEHGLEQPRGARCAFQVTDLRLDRAKRDAMLDGRAFGEQLGRGLHFGHIPGPGRGAMAFEERHGRGVQPGALPGASQGQDLPDGIGGRDALALAVAGTTHAANHRVDAIARLLRVLQALAHEEGTTLAHDKTVGVLVIGSRAVGRERPDLAELDEGGGAHVAVHGARDHHVVVVIDQAVGRCLQGGQRRSARCVGGEVRPAQVEHGGHPAGGDVGQFAGHGVFGAVGKTPAH